MRNVQEQEYIARINRVLDYIQTNLEKTMFLKDLANIAGFSPFHFHRIFKAMVGETLTSYIQRLRVEKAATLLLANPKEPITNVALDCGFSSSASFARLFRDHFQVSASQWRARREAQESKNGQTNRNNRKEFAASLRYLGDGLNGEGARRLGKRTSTQTREGRKMSAFKNVSVAVNKLETMTVAYIRYIGPYKGDVKLFESLWSKLAAWAGPRGLFKQPDVKCLIIYHDNPEITDDKNLRVSVCISAPRDLQVSGEIGKMEIPAGTYAMAHFEINGDQFQAAWDYVCGEWMPKSGYQPDDGPCFELCLNDPKEHPQHKHIVEICVPVKPL